MQDSNLVQEKEREVHYLQTHKTLILLALPTGQNECDVIRVQYLVVANFGSSNGIPVFGY